DPFAFTAEPDPPAVVEATAADPRWRATFRTDDLDVRRVERRLTLHDAAFDVSLRIGFRVPLDEIDALDDDAELAGQYAQNAPALAAVPSGEDEHVVVLSNR